jgi:hypothetical protein
MHQGKPHPRRLRVERRFDLLTTGGIIPLVHVLFPSGDHELITKRDPTSDLIVRGEGNSSGRCKFHEMAHLLLFSGTDDEVNFVGNACKTDIPEVFQMGAIAQTDVMAYKAKKDER